MFTSSYFQFKGAGRIGISRGTPRGIPAGFRKYLPLAPAVDLLAEVTDYAEFRDRYRAQLDQLDPSRIIGDLQRLAGDCAVPTLLCYCNLGKPGSWCHRTLAAQWLTERTGLACVELNPAAVRKIRKAEQLALI